MKFCKRYEEYMKIRRNKDFPVLGLKKLKKILKNCRRESETQPRLIEDEGEQDNPNWCCVPNFSDHCSVCDGIFFPSLLLEMSKVVGFFNKQAKSLLELHLASGIQRCMIWFGGKLLKNDAALIQEGKELITYAIINSIALKKILKKYDKVHYSKQGQVFRSKAQKMHIEILHSPWLSELMAFHINLRGKNKPVPSDLLADFKLTFSDGRPILSCSLFDSLKLDIDLTCSICLETVFDPVCLSCGHIFCYMCCCSTASVTIVDGLKAAEYKAKCPLCRRHGVFVGAVYMDELNILLSKSCPEYWEQRLKSERIERLQQAKEHWESQCRAFMGI
ncbi:probable E3 ubiquitin-protein ligase BAH1-like 1 isoform X2 [Phalaenopsis equestris]|uniref:probable E3 ubiquitin-protein ligase BAH1-like 1 isoform X2 n=1 Tax=Phalaenopsis equestris TaxID=78828 RepID=UPI0009E4AD6A|nr:probable E3 ubiquitin-protein ligase BAH1-like 1 isoform X2 [Phalaenopsis equestris]